MAEEPDKQEDLTQCGLDEGIEAELLQTQRECTFMWTNKKRRGFWGNHVVPPKGWKIMANKVPSEEPECLPSGCFESFSLCQQYRGPC